MIWQDLFAKALRAYEQDVRLLHHKYTASMLDELVWGQRAQNRSQTVWLNNIREHCVGAGLTLKLWHNLAEKPMTE